MDAPPPDDLDPYQSRRPPRQRLRDHREEPKHSGEDYSTDDRSYPYPHKGAPMNDARLTVVFQWVAGIAASLLTIGIVWIASISVSTARKVDVLLDRPVPVPLWQYENDIKQLKERAATTDARITNIEQRQLDSITRYQAVPR